MLIGELLKVTYKSGIQPFAVLPSILTTRRLEARR
jgi:hypothetical protein